jgi:hypothetical protein
MTNTAVAFAVTLALAVAYGTIFRKIYPLVNIDAGLALGFALAGILTYLFLRIVLLRVIGRRTSR